MNQLKSIGQQVKAARLSFGIGYQKLSKLTGVHKSTIIRIEKGEQPYNIDSLIKISDYLGVECHMTVT